LQYVNNNMFVDFNTGITPHPDKLDWGQAMIGWIDDGGERLRCDWSAFSVSNWHPIEPPCTQFI
jgi:hypothetical protein